MATWHRSCGAASAHRKMTKADADATNAAADEEEEEEDSNRLYCICKQPYDGEVFMICCDLCNEWYHGECVLVDE